jgi:hypothetical protein
MPGMKRMRWVAWFAGVLLLVALVASGAHVHHGAPAGDASCVACTLAHAPIAPDDAAPAVRAPEPTHEVLHEIPVTPAAAPLCAVPASRAPPLG